jgi:hypothetical protein
VILSEQNKQDSNFVIESINYILSLKLFQNLKKFYFISDNAVNLKNGFDFFNLFSKNSPLYNPEKTFVRIYSWFFCFDNGLNF